MRIARRRPNPPVRVGSAIADCSAGKDRRVLASLIAMAPSEHPRRWRRWFLLCLAAVLGAALVVMPALASSEGGPIEAGGGPPYYEWQPMSVSVSSGGQVTLKNPSTSTEHGVHWNTGPATPSCSGVPLAGSAKPSGTNWSGTCTFSTPGEYTFYCTVHGAPMSGRVIVSAAGTTTTTSTSTSTPTGPPTTTGTTSYPGYEPGAPIATGGGAVALLAGTPSKAVKVAANQRGHAVHGSVAISPAGAGAHLEVDLLARSAGLASAGHGALVRIGRLVVSHVVAGAVRFSVALSRNARAALARRRRLAVTVRMTLRSASATPLTVTRTVLLRP